MLDIIIVLLMIAYFFIGVYFYLRDTEEMISWIPFWGPIMILFFIYFMHEKIFEIYKKERKRRRNKNV